MNRREFIKKSLAGIAILGTFPSVMFGFNKPDNFNKPYGFKPDFYYGEWVKVKSHLVFDIASEFIDKRMKSIVPAEYQKQVEIIVKELGSNGTEDPLRQWGTVGWKYIPEKPWLDEIDTGERRYLKADDYETNSHKRMTVSTYPPCYDNEVKNNPYFGWGNNPDEPIRVFE